MSTATTRFFQLRLSRGLATATLVTTVIVIAAYALQMLQIGALLPGNRPMSPLTAIALTLIALSLSIFAATNPSQHRLLLGPTICIAAIWIAAALGLLLVLSNIVRGVDVISPAVAHWLFHVPASASGQTSAATAGSLVFLALSQRQRLKDHLRSSAILCAIPLFVSAVALLGYAYGVHELYALRFLNTIALHSSAAIFALSLATMLAQPGRAWLQPLVSTRRSAVATRRLFVFVLGLPVAGGILRYATVHGVLNVGLALAILVIVTVAPLIVLILYLGATQEALDDEHDMRQQTAARFAEDMKIRLEEQAIALRRESEERIRAEDAVYRVQKLEAMGQLTGGVAHDFNNLLMAITSSLYLLWQYLPPDHPGRKHLSNASAAASRGEKLTSQLLAFSRTQRLDIRPLQLEPVLRIAVSMIGNALGPRIDIQWQMHASDVHVLADAVQLELAILNLALNARDAMPNGGIFFISTDEEDIVGADGKTRSFISISASDTGTGMSAVVAEKAVEPFFTTKGHGRGTGLGLAQVYGVVKQCGGEFRLESTLGAGTTIHLLLPSILPSQRVVNDEAPGPPPLRPRMDRSKPLLLIDDDENVRSAMAELFKSEGYTVLESGNGQAGVDLLDSHEPAAAIIDFLMPGINGAEAARLARLKMPDLPIIFVSGYADTVALDTISNAIVLRKPVDADKLLNAVADAI